LKVAFLPKQTRGETVVGRLVLRFGNEKSLLPLKDAASYVGPMLMCGTKSRTREQIKDELDKVKSTLSGSSSTGNLTFTLQSKNTELAQVLDILKDVLREPTFPEKEFEVLKDNRKQSILAAMVEPQALAFHSLVRQLQPYPKADIRYLPT